MEIDKAIWHPSLSGMFLRVPIGLYFFLSGRLLLQDPEGLIDVIKSFGLVPEGVAYLYAIILPYAEIV